MSATRFRCKRRSISQAATSSRSNAPASAGESGTASGGSRVFTEGDIMIRRLSCFALLLIATLPFVLFASPLLPANSVVELLAYARAHPGEINFGSTGVGSGLHLIGELFKSEASLQIVHVPYKGIAQALPEMMSGKVQIAFNTIPAFLPHVKSGRLKALVITSTLRSPLLPDVPTTPEVGLPGVLGASWHAVVAPAGTQRELVNRLNRTLVGTIAASELRNTLVARGARPVGSP